MSLRRSWLGLEESALSRRCCRISYTQSTATGWLLRTIELSTYDFLLWHNTTSQRTQHCRDWLSWALRRPLEWPSCWGPWDAGGHSLVSLILQLTLKSKNGLVQGALDDHPGRGRTNHAKDWTVANTCQIDWEKLTPFLRRHAKALDSYIKETFM